MGWAVGYDTKWKRDIGYGVPSICDHPECETEINRGLAYVCANQEPYGGEGCGLFFCELHRNYRSLGDDEDGEDDLSAGQFCERCLVDGPPFDPKPDTPERIAWKLTDSSWQQWREENPKWVASQVT
jgi:hypothetical protein